MEALENVFSIKQCATPLYRLGTNHEKRVRVWFMSWCSWIEKKRSRFCSNIDIMNTSSVL